MHGGPWLIRHHAVVTEEYNGINRPSLHTCLGSDHGSTGLAANRLVARAMASKIEVLDLELGLNRVEYKVCSSVR